MDTTAKSTHSHICVGAKTHTKDFSFTLCRGRGHVGTYSTCKHLVSIWVRQQEEGVLEDLVYVLQVSTQAGTNRLEAGYANILLPCLSLASLEQSLSLETGCSSSCSHMPVHIPTETTCRHLHIINDVINKMSHQGKTYYKLFNAYPVWTKHWRYDTLCRLIYTTTRKSWHFVH